MVLTVFPIVAKLSTEETHIVTYVSETVSLPCGHSFKSNLQSVAWKKKDDKGIKVVAEYDIGDTPPVNFYDRMKDRASAIVFPPTLRFPNVSLEDAADYYQCVVIAITGDPIVYYHELTVNGKPLICLKTCCSAYIFPVLKTFRLTFLRMRD